MMVVMPVVSVLVVSLACFLVVYQACLLICLFVFAIDICLLSFFFFLILEQVWA